jgi:aminoglycoside 3-N-acetyltransferase I
MKNEIEEFEMKRLRSGDAKLLQKLNLTFQEVFETPVVEAPSPSYLEKCLEQNSFLAYVILQGDQVIGGLTAYELPMYSAEHSEIFLYDIAVRKDFQRKGLGKKLLEFLNLYCKTNNIKLMFVEAHEEDEHALEFYHSTGGKAERVMHFNFNIK